MHEDTNHALTDKDTNHALTDEDTAKMRRLLAHVETTSLTTTENPQPIIRQALTPPPPSQQAAALADTLRTRCKQLCTATFFQKHTLTLGFTSSIHGEGKSFLARLAAEVMIEEDNTPITLLDCNWAHPSLSTSFHLPSGPGLAEWLFEECSLAEIRHEVMHNLTVIAAGDHKNNALGLLRALQQHGTTSLLTRPNELLIVDLPSITTTSYGQLAASLVDSLILVVRTGVTPAPLVTQASQMLQDVHVEGVIFNQVASSLPRWLRRIL